MTRKFEYKILKTTRDDQGDEEKILNELGQDGWEVIQVELHTAAGYNVWLKKEA